MDQKETIRKIIKSLKETLIRSNFSANFKEQGFVCIDKSAIFFITPRSFLAF